MRKPRVYRTQEVDLTKFDFPEKVTINQSTNQKTVKGVTYEGKPFYFQTPKMFNAWGLDVSQQKNEAGEPVGNPAYYLRMSFGKEPGMTAGKFRQLLKDMEGTLREACKQNSIKWLGERPENLTDDILENVVASQVNVSVNKETMEPDGEWPDNCRFRFPFVPVDATDKEGNPDPEANSFPDYLEVFDENNQPVPVSSVDDMKRILTKGCHVQAILSLTGLYISSKVGYTWRVRHLQVFPSSGSTALTGYVIRNDNDDDVDE